MTELVTRLSYMNVSPYYVYQHDMVSRRSRSCAPPSVQPARSSAGARQRPRASTRRCSCSTCPAAAASATSTATITTTAVTGISVYRAPSVCADQVYLYFDPVGLLPQEGRERWARPAEHALMMAEAVSAAGLSHLRLAVQ